MLRSHQCEFCKLSFENSEDLARHQKKFCVNSEYGNVTRLEKRLNDLTAKPGTEALMHQAMPGLSDIKSYLRGGAAVPANPSFMADRRALEDFRAYQGSGSTLKETRNNQDPYLQQQRGGSADLVEQVASMKQHKQVSRQAADNVEQDYYALLQDLEQRKERDLRAQIEQEEIRRNIRDFDSKQLGAVEKEKKRELEKLATERDQLRVREQQMLEEVKRMEEKLLEQERQVQAIRDSSTTAGTKGQYQGMYSSISEKDWGAGAPSSYEADLRRKEMELAKERGSKVVEIKSQRDKLERDRHRIMEDLEKIRSGAGLPYRRNEAAMFVADQSLRASNGFQGLEPSLKEKLISDQNRINALRNQQRSTMNDLLPEMEDLDTLQKQMDAKGSYADQAANFVNQYDARNNPNRPQHLETIRNKLENQSAVPSSFYGQHQKNNVNMEDMYQGYNPLGTDQEPYIPHHVQAKSGMINNLNSLKDEYLLKGGEDPEFLTKVNELENFIKYRKPLGQRQQVIQPPPLPVSMSNQQPLPSQSGIPSSGSYPSYPTSQVGYPPIQAPPMMMAMPPPQMPQLQQTPDPIVEQMSALMKQQEQETMRLKQALQNLNGAGGNPGQLDQIIDQTGRELEELKAKLMMSQIYGAGRRDSNGIPGESPGDYLDDEFVFRQNEMRSEDLQVEERALMNLAAQEYDALRILSRLPPDSDLYQYKMNQYREMSTMRAEMEKMLQEQRIEKIRREFEKQKLEEERRFKHEMWVEEQKRRILEAKIKNASMLLQAPIGEENEQVQDQFQYPPDPGFQNSSPVQMQDSNSFVLGIDYVFNIPREYRQMRIVYSVGQNKRSLIDPRMVDLRAGEADMDKPGFNKIFFNVQQLIRGVVPHQSANLIIEFQIPDPNKPEGFSSLGWTILNVFDPELNLNKGRFRLPLYRTPTVLDLDLRDIQKLMPLFNMQACVRICMPNDDVFQQRPNIQTKQTHYDIPSVHKFASQGNQAPIQDPLPQASNQMMQMPPSVSNLNRQPSQNQQQSTKKASQGPISPGITVQLHYVRGYKPFQRAKVQATLYEGPTMFKLDNNQECNWATMGVDQNYMQVAPKGSKIEVKPDGTLNIIRQTANVSTANEEIIVPFNQEISWVQDFSTIIRDHGQKDNIYLLLQAFLIPQKTNTGPLASSQYENIGYTVLQLNNPDTTIRYGTYELAFYKPPINLLKQDVTQALPTMVKFTIGQPKQLPPPTQGDVVRTAGGRPISEQFIPNFDKQWTKSENFLPGDGVDIYIDWARFLPDNTTFTRVFVRVVDINGTFPIQAQRGFASVEFSTARNPFFGFKYEVRATKFNPTLLLIVSFETIDRATNQPCYAGHSYFPLFMDRVTELPITDANAQQMLLHKGFYQMPVYSQMPNLSPPITYEKFFSLEKIPTASMLIRILKAPKGPDGLPLALDSVPQDQWESKGVLVHAPAYQDGIYSTQYYFNTPLELQMFKLRRLRKEGKLQNVVDRLMALAKKPTTMTMDQKLDVLNEMIRIPPQSTLSIDMNYFAPYNPDLGFRFEVEAIYNNQSPTALFMVLASLCPHATLYDAARAEAAMDCIAFNEVDWSSHVHTQRFIDGLYMMQNITPRVGMSIIFDIKRLMPGQPQYENFGFSMIPLFSQLRNEDDGQMEFYVNSGIYQLPIYQGPIPMDLVTQLRATQDPTQVLSLAQAKFKLLDTSLIIEIVDNQRERHFEKGFEVYPPSLKFMPGAAITRIGYKPLTKQQNDTFKKLSSLIPVGQMPAQYQSQITDMLFRQFKL